jgi:outer membrane protein insertion porin family
MGLRYSAPIGPIRLDYGRKLDPQGNEATGHFHFSIGQAF